MPAGAEQDPEDGLPSDPSSELDPLDAIVDDSIMRLPPEERGDAVRAHILRQLDEDKAEDLVSINLAGKSDIADVMIVASGRSQRHVGALADRILRMLKDFGVKNVRCEGKTASDWVLIDVGDTILHLFRPEVRTFYNLERIWSESAHGPASVDSATADT